MTTFKILVGAIALTLLSACEDQPRAAEGTAERQVRVILVHGAFADESAWRKVAPLLEARGLEVNAVTLPLTSLADDVAVVRTAIDRLDGRVILVGHSWGGAVITEAGNDAQVVGLVYVAAVAPEPGQSTSALLSQYPAAPAASHIKPNARGGLQISTEGMCQDFAQDLPVDCEAMARAQRPIAGTAFDEAVSTAAWQDNPTWYVLAERDRAMPPQLQQAMAQRIGARITRVATSHVAMLAAPERVADVIAKAASESTPRNP